MGIFVIVKLSQTDVDTPVGQFVISVSFAASDGVNSANDYRNGVNVRPPFNSNKRTINDMIIDAVTANVETQMGGTVDKIFFQPFDRG